MSTLLILKTGSTLPDLVARQGDFEDWTLRAIGMPRERVCVINVQSGQALPDYEAVSGGIVITGSHAMVTEHQAWSERLAAWLSGAVARAIPILGICYGHQLLAYALGGEVGDNACGREFGTVQVQCTEAGRVNPLFVTGQGPPLPTFFAGHVAHTQSVLRLPPGAEILATTAREHHAAIAFAPMVWGVQFHPEFNAEAMRAYIHAYAGVLRAEGQDPKRLLAGVSETPTATAILRRFVALLA